MHIYIYIERERERYAHTYIYIYIYIYILSAKPCRAMEEGQCGRFPKFHRVFLGRDPGTLKSDIVPKKHPQAICSDLRLST